MPWVEFEAWFQLLNGNKYHTEEIATQQYIESQVANPLYLFSYSVDLILSLHNLVSDPEWNILAADKQQ